MSGLAAGLCLAACAPPAANPSHGPRPYGPDIAIDAQPVPLNPRDPRQERLGPFTYAGGLALTSDDTTRLHGLSDLKVWPDGRMLAVGDEGDLLEAQLVLDAAGRPIGLSQARLTEMIGEDGQPVRSHGKREADSEGIAELPNGDRLISFEEDDRILLYPHVGGRPRRAPMPDERFPPNKGMEALAQDPAIAPDAYLAGGEASGQTWICRLSTGCVQDRRVAKDGAFGLTAVAPLPAGRVGYLLRAYDPLRGVRVELRILEPDGRTAASALIANPLSVDNFEGLAAVPQAGGGVRLYLISDDNFSSSQRTLLVAFDWRPPTPR
jgi:hypothetical protein